jgi:manganese transport protein
VILIANLIAVILQYLCVKLGLVLNRDLAQASRKYTSWRVNLALYVICEMAIIATDLAEVIGTAIALNLLFGIPITVGIVLTGLDVLVILVAWDKKHFKAFEVATVFTVFAVSV